MKIDITINAGTELLAAIKTIASALTCQCGQIQEIQPETQEKSGVKEFLDEAIKRENAACAAKPAKKEKAAPAETPKDATPATDALPELTEEALRKLAIQCVRAHGKPAVEEIIKRVAGVDKLADATSDKWHELHNEFAAKLGEAA